MRRIAPRVRAALRPALAYLTRRPIRGGLATGAFAIVLAICPPVGILAGGGLVFGRALLAWLKHRRERASLAAIDLVANPSRASSPARSR